MLQVLLSQASSQEPETSFLFMLLVQLGPFLLIGLLLYLVIFKFMKKSNPAQDRYWAHLELMEQKADRIIELLEKMRDSQKN